MEENNSIENNQFILIFYAATGEAISLISQNKF